MQLEVERQNLRGFARQLGRARTSGAFRSSAGKAGERPALGLLKRLRLNSRLGFPLPGNPPLSEQPIGGGTTRIRSIDLSSGTRVRPMTTTVFCERSTDM